MTVLTVGLREELTPCGDIGIRRTPQRRDGGADARLDICVNGVPCRDSTSLELIPPCACKRSKIGNVRLLADPIGADNDAKPARYCANVELEIRLLVTLRRPVQGADRLA